MQLRVFRASTTAQAMAQVRLEFGDDALILGSRRVAGVMEVTAARELEAPAASIAPAREAVGRRWLDYHGVPRELHSVLLATDLAQALADSIRFGSLPQDEPVLLVGPPGGGKTLTAVRLATRMVMRGIAPMVITSDGQRAGATEQLAAFTRLLRINLIVANSPVTLGRAMTRRPVHSHVLIDSAGTDPFLASDLEEMRALAASAGARIVLVLPAGLDATEAAEIACAYAEAGASLMVATRLDLALRLGGLIAAAVSAGLTLTDGGIGPGAADGLTPLTATALASRIAKIGEMTA